MAIQKRSQLLNRSSGLSFFIVFLVFCLGLTGSEPQTNLGPLPPLPAPNPTKVELGKFLFFDPRLSGDGSLSCASCHDPVKGWTDGLPLSKAYPGSLYFRNTKTILNAAYAPLFYWDGRLDGGDMDTQVRDSITESHFMNMDGRLMLERLKQVPEYVALFQRAFNGEPSFGLTLKAIAAFEQSLVSRNVSFDEGQLSDKAKQGLALFEGRAGCIQCHNGAYFSDGQVHGLGLPEAPEVFQEPLRHMTYRSFMKFLGTPNYMNLRRDVGYYAISKDYRDIGKFLTPTLREVARTAPYMHNGVFGTLEEVIDFYDRGGGENENRSPMLKPLHLSSDEKEALVQFLHSLSGDEVVVEKPSLPEYRLIENWRAVKN